MRMTLKTAGLVAVCWGTIAIATAPAPVPIEQKLASLPWVNSPSRAEIAARASIALQPNVRFLSTQGTDELMKLTGNLPDAQSYTLADKAMNWFAVYSFADIGYVKDDEKIDADALLKSMRESQEASNEERTKQGLEPLTIVGWAVAPHYDRQTHNLEYGLTLSSPSGTNVNYHVRMLGRRGVMDGALVTSQAHLQEDLAAFRTANAQFAYNADEGYGAFKDGDKVSEYGLAALITGGAAAAAVKGGLFKGLLLILAKFGKIIALAAVGGFVAFRKFLGRLFGKGEYLGPSD